MDISTVMMILAFATAYYVWFRSVTRSLKGPKGPKLWPVVGSLPGLIENNSRLHEWIADNLRACGGTYQTCICAIPFLARKQGLVTVTCDPKNLEHILKVRFDNYPKGPTWQAVFHDLLGQGIFNSDGDTWLFQRKTAALEFTTRTLRQAMARWVSRAIKNRFCPILKTAELEGKRVELQDLLLRLTFDNICGLAFGKDPQTLSLGLPENSFATAFDRATEATLQRFIFPEFIWKFKKWLRLGMEASLSRSIKHVDDYMTDIINTRKLELSSQQNGGSLHDDLLSRFMKKKESYSDEFLQYVVLNFILAGRDTSSVALSWFFWLVILNPKVEEKILIEICSVLLETRGNDTSKWLDDPLAFEEVDRLTYLKAALSETLRLYPSVPEDSKHVISDDVLPDGTFVPGGSNITYSIYSTGRMKFIWGDDCLEFKPERWFSDDGKKFEAKDQFQFVAFNAGPRICLGKDLAYLQMKSIAAAVLLRHRLTVAPGHRVEQKMSLTLFMKDGLKVNVHARDLAPILEKICGTVESREGEPISNGLSFGTGFGILMALRAIYRSLRRNNDLPLFYNSCSYLHSHSSSFGFKEIKEEEKSQMVGNVFTSVASSYDLMNDLMSGGLHRLWKERLVSKLNPFPGMKHLDVAGGTGDVAFRILDHINSVRNRAMRDIHDDNLLEETSIYVCDINPNMLNVGKKRAQERGLGDDKSLIWVEGDAEALKFENNTMDGYTIAFGIRNVTHIEKALEEAHRVLKPGGRFLCLELSQVDIPIFKELYDLYSFKVIPALGELMAGDRESYQYLVESIRRFPPQEKFASMIADAGFQKVEYENLVGVVVAIHSGLKF